MVWPQSKQTEQATGSKGSLKQILAQTLCSVTAKKLQKHC